MRSPRPSILSAACLALAAALLASHPARGEVTAAFAFGHPTAPPNGWELLHLRISGDVVAGMTGFVGPAVTVRDARGGVAVVRHARLLPAGGPGGPGGGPNSPEAEAWIPLPLVAPAELPAAAGDGGPAARGWLLDVTVEADADGGRRVERVRTNIRLADAPFDPATQPFHVIVPADERAARPPAASSANWSAVLTSRPVVELALPADEILAGPLLTFAAADAVLLTPGLRDQLTEARASGLLAAGVQLVAVDDAPPAGALSRLVWDRASAGAEGGGRPRGAAVWRSPPQPLRRPTVIEPGLARLAVSQAVPPLPAGLRWAVILAGPAAAGLAVLAWGLFRKPAAVLAAAGGAAAVLSAGVVLYLRAGSGGDPVRTGWRATAGSPADVVGAVTAADAVWTSAPVFRRTITVVGPAAGGDALAGGGGGDDGAPGWIVPLADAPRSYFGPGGGGRLVLDAPSPYVSAGPVSTLTFTAPARRSPGERGGHAGGGGAAGAYMTRSALVGGLVPPPPRSADGLRRFGEMLHADVGRGVWVEGGYVFPGAAGVGPAARRGGGGVLFTRWAEDQPAVRDAALAWYELRFDARRRYFVWVDGGLNVIDYGGLDAPE